MIKLPKLSILIYVILVFSSILVLMDIRATQRDILSTIIILGICVYSGFGVLAGWDLLTFAFELKVPKIILPIYLGLKFYLSIYIGLFYLPIWVVKK